MQQRIRVLIADDSSLARAMLREILQTQPDIEVVGEACNGQQAVDMAQTLSPQLITMDLEMPVMDGLQAITTIMHRRAVPILVVSSVSDAQRALEAVALGALEVVPKPDTTEAAAAHLIARVRLLAGVAVITRLRTRLDAALPVAAPAAVAVPIPLPTLPTLPALMPASVPVWAPAPLGAEAFTRVFAIAASTGGPQALARILSSLPADFSCPIVVAQHISDGFAQGMVDWLASICPLSVHLAQEAVALVAGRVYIAPSEYHLAVGSTGQLQLRARCAGDCYHPSCDVLLTSVAQVYGPRAVGIILSGMGHDGAAGMAAILAAGGSTWAQDEASSVIFGMNRIAIERGAVQQVLDVAVLATHMQNTAQQALGWRNGA